MRRSKTFQLPSGFNSSQLISWAKKYEIYSILDSHRNEQLSNDRYKRYDIIAGIGAVEELNNETPAFDALNTLYKKNQDWLFGYFSYDLKNEIENLQSDHPDGLKFPSIHFFRPKYVIRILDTKLTIDYVDDESESIEQLLQEILLTLPEPGIVTTGLKLHPRVSKPEYLKRVNQVKNHIRRGDVYELNYCVEYFSENISIAPESVYEKLTQLSPMPFSCFYKLQDKYLLCASPERFLAKRGNQLISQPIKGTARRADTPEADDEVKKILAHDPKERAENVMIVDLVRNDLSKFASMGSVIVEELCGIYTFRNLHQMISTVVCELKSDIDFADSIKAAFPMGSMTGAPKIRAMELIEEFESTKRGLYSGATGYIEPSGNFDFNVVIRSILYNRSDQYVSFMVGSAITDASDPELEYQECQLKAEAMQLALNSIS